MTDESQTDRPGPRFLTLKDVQDELQISPSQAMSLIRSGELRATQIGGRGQWRIERIALEEFIAEAYRRAEQRAATTQALDDMITDAERLGLHDVGRSRSCSLLQNGLSGRWSPGHDDGGAGGARDRRRRLPELPC